LSDELDESLLIAPNPVASSTFLTFKLESPSMVRAEVFNLGGQKVATLIEGSMNKGVHRINWNGSDDSGSHLPGGVYFVKIQTDRASVTRKVVVL
jgi:flagellar hook assembly protein FlgD